jgi:hypothetical protein
MEAAKNQLQTVALTPQRRSPPARKKERKKDKATKGKFNFIR